MLESKKVAVTGTLASGKSTVCRYFKQLGAHTVSADEIVHELLAHHTDLVDQVTRLLGNDVLLEGKLSREAIAAKVFQDPSLLLQLEGLIHPHVFERLAAERRRADGLFVAEIPLLFETGAERDFDATIAVVSAKGAQRSGLSPEEFQQRTILQLPTKEKVARADYVITNNGSLEELQAAVAEVHQQLTQ